MNSRLGIDPAYEGHHLRSHGDAQLSSKLTYQQLLHLNGDLSKENQYLKNHANRLGVELRKLQGEFQLKEGNENADIYHAIGARPQLHEYEPLLTGLFDTYEIKIQEYETLFETINDEFAIIESLYKETVEDNKKLKEQLTTQIKENIQLYRGSLADKSNPDFGSLILKQNQDKQELLGKENYQLQQDSEHNKASAYRNQQDLKKVASQVEVMKGETVEHRTKIKELETEVELLRKNNFDLKSRNNELESSNKKVSQDLQRGEAQLNRANKSIDAFRREHNNLQDEFERAIIPPENNQDKVIQQLNDRIAIMEAGKGPSNIDQLYNKLQKEFEQTNREKVRVKETLDMMNVREEQLTQANKEAQAEISKLKSQNNTLELSENRLKKSLEQMAEKSKNDIMRLQKVSDDDKEQLEEELNHKLQLKDKKIAEFDEQCEKIKLERDKLEKELSITTSSAIKDSKGSRNRENERVIEKLREKLSINEEIFKEQIQLVENDNKYLKKEVDSYKQDHKEKGDELRRMKQENEQLRKSLEECTEQKAFLIDEIRRVRNQYEGELKDKERHFDEQIKEIKLIIEDFNNRRKQQKESTHESQREYKRKLEELKHIYEERIRVLESNSMR